MTFKISRWHRSRPTIVNPWYFDFDVTNERLEQTLILSCGPFVEEGEAETERCLPFYICFRQYIMKHNELLFNSISNNFSFYFSFYFSICNSLSFCSIKEWIYGLVVELCHARHQHSPLFDVINALTKSLVNFSTNSNAFGSGRSVNADTTKLPNASNLAIGDR